MRIEHSKISLKLCVQAVSAMKQTLTPYYTLSYSTKVRRKSKIMGNFRNLYHPQTLPNEVNNKAIGLYIGLQRYGSG